jgi:hypothetical protein
MPTVSISKPEGAVSVSIKHEGEDRGHAFGPALWLDAEGKVIANVIDSDIENTLRSIDFKTGEEVDMPKFYPEWMDFREVYQMAKHFGVKVVEA